ncbi:MAG TPA: hypothetical protein DCW74_10100 [Alteromonas australica]|uniref:Uncharacterized protein n=1 Tax=Alteromonas australica TaxID=589873 RepID=A0A350P453_9ALTE|nr:hypothetical protein [Alteromonas australica]|tara:strand:- start:5718 stop:6518 length:801 start_codon:yes stop_codon:yes gene_type:complete
MSGEIREEIQQEETQQPEREVQQEVDEGVQQEAQQEEKPRSGYIDYNALPEEVRDTVKMRVDGDFRKMKALEKKELEYQQKLKEYEEKLSELNRPKEIQPPTADDFYNDPEGAEKRLQDYNNYVSKKVDWDTSQKLREQHQQQEIERQQAERQQLFLKKAESAGISQQELAYAASIAAPVLGDDAQSYLVGHDYGPQILRQLVKNPMDLQELANLNPYQVGVKVENMAKNFKPTKVTKAPPPDEPIQGSGVDSKDEYPILKGSTIF